MILYSVLAGEEGEVCVCEACIYITIKLILMTNYICTLYSVEGQVMPSGIGSLHGIIVT